MYLSVCGPDGSTLADNLSQSTYLVMKHIVRKYCQQLDDFKFVGLCDPWAYYLPFDLQDEFKQPEIISYARMGLEIAPLPGGKNIYIAKFSKSYDGSDVLNKTFSDFRITTKVEGTAQLWQNKPRTSDYEDIVNKYAKHVETMIVFPTKGLLTKNVLSKFNGKTVIVTSEMMDMVSLYTPAEEIRIFAEWNPYSTMTAAQFVEARKNGTITGSLLREMESINEKRRNRSLHPGRPNRESVQ